MTVNTYWMLPRHWHYSKHLTCTGTWRPPSHSEAAIWATMLQPLPRNSSVGALAWHRHTGVRIPEAEPESASDNLGFVLLQDVGIFFPHVVPRPRKKKKTQETLISWMWLLIFSSPFHYKFKSNTWAQVCSLKNFNPRELKTYKKNLSPNVQKVEGSSPSVQGWMNKHNVVCTYSE